MNSRIIEALKISGLLDKYNEKFEEKNIEDRLVEQWLQNFSHGGLKTVITSPGDRTRFARAFQQLPSYSSRDDNTVSNYNAAPQHSSGSSRRFQEHKRRSSAFDGSTESISLSRKNKNPSNNITSIQPAYSSRDHNAASNYNAAPQHSSGSSRRFQENKRSSSAFDESTESTSFSSKNKNSIDNLPSVPQPLPETQDFELPTTSSPNRNQIPDNMKTKQKAALDLLENEFRIRIEILQAHKYFNYLNVQGEIDEIKNNIKRILPSFLNQQNTTFKVETEFKKKSAALKKQNNANKQQRTEAENQLEQIFELLCESEFLRLEQVARKNLPEPFTWTVNLNKLHRHFDFFLKNLATPNSTNFELEFQKDCRETCRNKIEGLCEATKFSSYVVKEYSRKMKIGLENLEEVSKFTQLHEATLSSDFKKYSMGPVDPLLNTATWKNLLDLTESILADYKNAFWEKIKQTRKEESLAAVQMTEVAVEEYVQHMDQKMSQGSLIFKTSEISKFHTVALDHAKASFFSHPVYKNSRIFKTSWEKLERKLTELEKNYKEKNSLILDKNALKAEKKALQKQVSFYTAQEEYRKLMDSLFFTHSREKSLARIKIEDYHKYAMERSLAFYETKSRITDTEDCTKISKEALIQVFLKEREKLIKENDDKIARELKEEQDAKAKEDEQWRKRIQRDTEWKNKLEMKHNEMLEQLEQQRLALEEKFASSPKIQPTIFKTSSQKIAGFEGGIAIHFNSTGVNVGSFQRGAKYTLIYRDIPPVIAFTPQDILIGKEAASLAPSKFTKFDLFDLLQSDKNDAQKVIVKTKVMFLRTEEILAIFLHKISILISNVHPAFHPSSCFVEFVISPFPHLPVKQMIKHSLTLADFSKAHLLQSTSAMAMSHFYHNPDKLEQNVSPHYILGIHSSRSTYDLVVASGSGHTVAIKYQTSLPHVDKPGDSSGLFSALRNLVTGGQERSLKQSIQEVLRESKLRASDIQEVISVGENFSLLKDLQTVVTELFSRQVKVVDDFAGLLQGAAAFAGWKAGLKAGAFSPRLNLEEIHPHFLTAQFTKTGGGYLNFLLINKNDPCGQKTRLEIYTVPNEVYRFSNKICIFEGSDKTSLKVAEFEAGNVVTKGTIVGTQLEFQISPEGLIDIRWPPNSPWTQKLPIVCNSLWMDTKDLVEACRKVDEISRLMTGPKMTAELGSIKPPRPPAPSSWTSLAPPSVSTTVLKSPEVKNIQSCIANHQVKAAEVRGPERKELETLVQEVKVRLDNSPGTSSLVRGKIEELLKEIEGVLSSTGVEVALFKSYASRLEILAKRIK